MNKEHYYIYKQASTDEAPKAKPYSIAKLLGSAGLGALGGFTMGSIGGDAVNMFRHPDFPYLSYGIPNYEPRGALLGGGLGLLGGGLLYHLAKTKWEPEAIRKMKKDRAQAAKHTKMTTPAIQKQPVTFD